jgi:DNA-binding transcriptional LysR family regulator
MDRLEVMAVFVAVVEAGSLSAAGRLLDMPLATVSRKLAELEAHLKASLLNRSTRRLELTDSGRLYLDACKRILSEVGDAERAAAGEYSQPKGELVITAPVVFGRLHVLPIVTQFLQAFADVDVRLVLGDRVSQLLDEHIDLAVRIGPLQDSAYKVANLGWLHEVVCASPAYLLAHGTPRLAADVAQHACVTFDTLAASHQWLFHDQGVVTPVPIRSRLIVNTAEAALDAAKAGLGLTRLLSYQVDEACTNGELRVVLDAYQAPTIPVSLVFNAQKHIPLKLRSFLDFAAPRLRVRLQRLARCAIAGEDGIKNPKRRLKTR